MATVVLEPRPASPCAYRRVALSREKANTRPSNTVSQLSAPADWRLLQTRFKLLLARRRMTAEFEERGQSGQPTNWEKRQDDFGGRGARGAGKPNTTHTRWFTNNRLTKGWTNNIPQSATIQGWLVLPPRLVPSLDAALKPLRNR